MSLVQLIYIVLKITTYFLLYVGGMHMSHSKTRKQYWKCAILPIMAYTLNSGLRFGRDIDYNLYYLEYNDLIAGKTDWTDFEPIFDFLVFLFGKLMGLEWQFMVMFMSFMLILACVFYVERYKEVANLALPLFVFNMQLAENTMRWFLAFSFILIGFSFYKNEEYSEKRRLYVMLLCFLLAEMTHYGIVIAILFYLLLMIPKRPLFSPKFSVCIFAFAIIFSSPLMFGELVDDVAQLEFLTGRYAHYAENAEEYVTGEGVDGYDGMDFSSYIYSLFAIIVGYKTVKENQSLVFPYNIVLFGIFTAPLFSRLEIGMRLRYVFYSFQFIILAYSFFYIFKNRLYKSILIKVLCVLLVLNMVRSQIARTLSMPDSHLLFVWDKNGREYLDVDRYYR